MKLIRGINAIIITMAVLAVAFILGTALGDTLASDIPTDDSAVVLSSCRWSDAVGVVDDYMIRHLSAPSDLYKQLQDETEAQVRKDFLRNFAPVDVYCGDLMWDWAKQAYIQFEADGHTSMDIRWLNS